MDSINHIAEEIKKLMVGEDRQDIEFRLNILLSEIGDAAKYVTHDQNLNPSARPHGSKNDEAMSYGQIFVQLVACSLLRGIDLNQAISSALENWQKVDWRKSLTGDDDKILTGIIGNGGEMMGEAFLDPEAKNLEKIDGQILVTKFLKPSHASFFKKIKAVITDHGSAASHPAILAREFDIPCIVGTGNATERIKHGQRIQIKMDGDQGIVLII
ncbi:MAG: PEP-utilizing enzyme [Patescibacteria group bacterium]|nr:PEP-utilizing enzyme [Patescibacteria group bacterium]